MEKCEWCNEETDDRIEYIGSRGIHYKICGICSNLAANAEWKKLVDRVFPGSR
jgi:hypothetical protein